MSYCASVCVRAAVLSDVMSIMVRVINLNRLSVLQCFTARGCKSEGVLVTVVISLANLEISG